MNSELALSALVALVVVLGLVVLAGQVVRRLGLAPGLAAAGRRGSGAAPRRLALLESLPIDPRRRLLLLRCDGRELLVLTGGPQDLLLSATPGAGAGAAAEPR
ncbi:flagellar biosynthetic protein FliO [Teichococcus aestuarii]|uniref:Flagellar assembly protein FliO n=1 Tax=Teichococcus aestuarii TaxID=568898 RepID=A0A2U1V308_9PROT|nr:flagellar biosynthetic protein FliO [Pseudoroseomonas aestuarii]PWC28263.1 hypothetical protein CR165_13290 [Pseudoroseomonas aestuarii]